MNKYKKGNKERERESETNKCTWRHKNYEKNKPGFKSKFVDISNIINVPCTWMKMMGEKTNR